MPRSELGGKNWILERYYVLAQMNQVANVLDLGAGCGTYASMLRPLKQDVHWTGVEIWAPYIKEFNLEQLYDEVIVADLRYLDYRKVRQPDCVIAGDVLEHMDEQSAIKVLQELVTLARFVFVSIPIVHMPQGEWGGNPYEKHVEDFYTHERLMNILPCVYDYVCDGNIGSYLLSRDVTICRILDEWNWQAKQNKDSSGS